MGSRQAPANPRRLADGMRSPSTQLRVPTRNASAAHASRNTPKPLNVEHAEPLGFRGEVPVFELAAYYTTTIEPSNSC
jgi:hypothetical protein